MKAIEEANRIGDTESARKALARLAELLENMEMQLTRGGQGEGGESMAGEMSEEMKESLEDLADLLGDQQQDGGEDGQDGEQSGEESGGEQQGGQQQGGDQGQGSTEQGSGALSPGELASRQGALQQALEALEGALPEEGQGSAIGDEDSESGQGVGGEEDPDSDAIGGGGEAQQDAAEALADAGEAMRESQDRLAQGDLAENEDPLGRENGGNDDNSEADLDTRDDATRSRELREELRRRAAEQDRDQTEREYLERLLERF